MAILGGILLAVGAIAGLVFAIWILVLAFQKSIVWGLVSLLVPFGILVFVFMHWDRAGKPFLYALGAMVLQIIGGIMTGSGLMSMMPPS